MGEISLPRSSAVLRFVVDGADLGAFTAREVSGSSRDGHIAIECTAVDPEAAARRPRDRQWETQALGSIVRTIAGDAGLTPVVNNKIGGLEVTARPQLAVSDLAFLQRLVESRGGRLILQEDRLVVTLGDQPVAALPALPALQVDLRAEGAWVDWRRGWSSVQQRVVAAYLLEDGVTLEIVEAGSGNTGTAPPQRLPIPRRGARGRSQPPGRERGIQGLRRDQHRTHTHRTSPAAARAARRRHTHPSRLPAPGCALRTAHSRPLRGQHRDHCTARRRRWLDFRPPERPFQGVENSQIAFFAGTETMIVFSWQAIPVNPFHSTSRPLGQIPEIPVKSRITTSVRAHPDGPTHARLRCRMKGPCPGPTAGSPPLAPPSPLSPPPSPT